MNTNILQTIHSRLAILATSLLILVTLIGTGMYYGELAVTSPDVPAIAGGDLGSNGGG